MTAVEPLRLSFRAQVRSQALVVARSLALERGWAKVRMGEVAALTGVSRPTLYKEFKNKQSLGEAVMFKEAERFVAKVAVILEREDDLGQGLIESIRFSLEEAARSPLLRSVITSTSHDDSGLLPLLTTRSAPIVDMASIAFSNWLQELLPDVAPKDLEELAIFLVRLTVSYIVLPVGDTDNTAREIAKVAVRYVRYEESSAVDIDGSDRG